MNKVLVCLTLSSLLLSFNSFAEDEDTSVVVDSYSSAPHITNNPALQDKNAIDDPTISSDAFSDKSTVKGAVDFQTAYEHMTAKKPDMVAAFYYLDKAAKQNYCSAYGYIGMMLIDGIGTNQDYNQAFDYFTKGDKCNDFQSTFGLGLCYENGYGVKNNVEDAIRYYKKAADSNYAPAQFNLSMLLFSLDSGSEDALNYLKKAARNRYAPALDLFYHAIDENRRKQGTMETEPKDDDDE